MVVAERRRSHVAQPDRAFATAVHKYIALVGMAFGCRDDFCQLLHIRRLDVYNIWEGGGVGVKGDNEQPRSVIIHNKTADTRKNKNRLKGGDWTPKNSSVLNLEVCSLSISPPDDD